jgi:hypothetical protein
MLLKQPGAAAGLDSSSSSSAGNPFAPVTPRHLVLPAGKGPTCTLTSCYSAPGRLFDPHLKECPTRSFPWLWCCTAEPVEAPLLPAISPPADHAGTTFTAELAAAAHDLVAASGGA